ncbi:hypothetical protein [Paenibacillus silvisoli]|uniref:hypothetical protein n=1 Tax=Paenibacillus silvisoli TaxID=3110539 RepID=UPI002805EF75|nr:hypothetical protein [Paenibacillus silvisoli]
MNTPMYVLLVSFLLWGQWKLMKPTAQKKDYVTVGLILSLAIVIGLCLSMGMQLTSPDMMLQRWLSQLVK